MSLQRLRGSLALTIVMFVVTVGTAHAEFAMSGYTQIDYHLYDDDAEADEFSARAVRLKGSGTIDERGNSAVLQIDLAKVINDHDEVVVRDAYLDRPLSDDWSIRLGLAAQEIGYEGPRSGYNSEWMERSRASGKFMPGQQELGLRLWRHARRAWEPEVIISYGNGMDSWHDDDALDEASAFVATVRFPFGSESVLGASYRVASRDVTTASGITRWDEDLLNLSVRWNLARFSFQGEYYDGQVADADASGWYSGLIYRPDTFDGGVYYRFDAFEADASDYHRNTVGGYWDFAPNERLTLELDSEDTGADTLTEVNVRWQFKY